MTYANPHAMSEHTNASLTSARGTVIGKAAHLRGLAVGYFKRVRRALPEGQTLPLDAWRPRHEVMLWLVWLHALGIFVFGLVVGAGPVHSVVEGSLVALWAVAANTTVFSRRTRSAAASLGLLTASAFLVHLAGGATEAHFHFFVMIAVIAIYQDWVPFLLAIGFVVVEHGVVGVIVPSAVYDHPDAWADPWAWALIHAAFVLAASAAHVAHWRLTELTQVERRRSEDELRASEERFRKQYKGFPLPTFSWRQEGDDFVLQDFNDAAESATEGKIRDWIGSQASEHNARQPGMLACLQACVTEHQTVRRQTLNRDVTTGRERHVALTYVFVPPLTVMVHAEDITEARQVEQQREAMAQSEKLRALGQMAMGIAHDLNQSLMLVASYSHLAQKALVEDPPNLADLHDLLTTTTQAAVDGGATVKRLLLFTRAAPGRDIQRIDLSNVVRDAAKLTAPRWRDTAQAEGRPVSLHIEAEGQPTIQGSPAQLRELMTNLIFNAIDALPTGGRIRLRVVAEDGNGIIEVTDSGVGMSPEVLNRVFEPFFTTKGETGTGMGLAMVFGIVEQHGGHIDVRSAPGMGTTFRIIFPLVEAFVEPQPLSTASRQLGPSRSLRILAVDDEPLMTKAVARMLRSSGYLVSAAGSAEEALEKLAEDEFDVVISDMGMGAGMNGWELADAVKSRWPGVRFVLATGWGAAVDPVEARTRGVEAVLAKPYQPHELLQAMATTDQAA